MERVVRLSLLFTSKNIVMGLTIHIRGENTTLLYFGILNYYTFISNFLEAKMHPSMNYYSICNSIYFIIRPEKPFY